MSKLSLEMERSVKLLARKITDDLKKPRLVWTDGKYKMIPGRVSKLRLKSKI
jgi:hypothetical protein